MHRILEEFLGDGDNTKGNVAPLGEDKFRLAFECEL